MSLANAILGTAPTSVFTSANANGSAITAIIFTNMDASARQVDLHACPAGEANAVENLILSVNIPSEESYVFSDKLILGNTDDIKALIDAASSDVACTVSYLDL